MLADVDLAAVGQVLGDTHRARFMLALMGGQELPAGELASRVGISSSLASAHLAKLVQSGLVTVRKQGRHRYFQLAGPAIAQAVEALLAIAPHCSATGLTSVTRGQALQRARTCYDHVAGRLGVALADSFEQHKFITVAASGWTLTSQGERRLSTLGVDVGTMRQGRRPVLRPCQDWTERRAHMAGALGQALADCFLRLEWVRRSASSRALVVTAVGERQLLAQFAISV